MRRVLYGRHRAATAPAGGSTAGIAATPRDAPERPTSLAQMSARPGVEFWRSGRIVLPRTRRPRRENRGIARKPQGAFNGAARTILPERHFCAPPPEDQPGPSRPILPEVLGGAATLGQPGHRAGGAWELPPRQGTCVGSGGVCTVDDVVDFLSWGLSVQDQAGSAVEAVLDGLDLGVGDVGEAGALGEVLADQSACVLVGGTLSGGCGGRRSRPGCR